MIPAEAKPCANDTQDCTRDDIEAVMHEVGIPCRRDVDCGTDGYKREDNEIGRRRSCLLARLNMLLVPVYVLVVEEGYSDCQFSTEEQGEICQAGEGDYEERCQLMIRGLNSVHLPTHMTNDR